MRIQEFSPSGGGGVEGPGPSDIKKLGQRCFVIFAVFSPHLQLIEQFYRGDRSQGPMVYFLENNIFQGSRVGPTFYGVGGGVQLFSRGGGGVQMLISVETYRNCEFPRTPYPLSVSAHALPSIVARTQ